MQAVSRGVGAPCNTSPCDGASLLSARLPLLADSQRVSSRDVSQDGYDVNTFKSVTAHTRHAAGRTKALSPAYAADTADIADIADNPDSHTGRHVNRVPEKVCCFYIPGTRHHTHRHTCLVHRPPLAEPLHTPSPQVCQPEESGLMPWRLRQGWCRKRRQAWQRGPLASQKTFDSQSWVVAPSRDRRRVTHRCFASRNKQVLVYILPFQVLTHPL